MAGKSSKQKRREEKAKLKEARSAQRTTIPDASPVTLLGLAAVLAILTCLAYSDSFKGKFVYDDTKWIEQMSVDRIQHPIESVLRSRRPVVDATLSLNYSMATLMPAPRAMTVREIPSPYGYHVVNLIIHILAGLVLFGLVRRTIRVGPFGDRVKQSAHWIAFCVALLWMLHPLQTQSVTYIIQRAESMMGLFYLLTIYCLLRYATSVSGPTKVIWLVCTIIASCLGMGSKAVMVTVPLVALTYDRVFLAKTWEEVIRKRWLVHACIVASLLVLMVNGVVKGVLFKPNARTATVGFGLANKKHLYYVSPVEYFLTEGKVIPRYLKLSVLPTDQALDYKMEKIDPHKLSGGELFTQSLLPGMLVLLLVGATVVALIKKPWLGFVGVWFFVILAPTSTFIPIRDPIYEHRMYLSLAAVLALFVAGIWFLLSRFGKGALGRLAGPICAGICLFPAVALGALTYQRNKVYQDPVVLWKDNVEKVPDNWRARNNLAKEYLDRIGKDPDYLDKAIKELLVAVKGNPKFVNGWYNLGNAYSKNNEYDKAIDAYRHALMQNPRYTVAHIMIGNAFTNKSNALLAGHKPNEAIEALEMAAKAFETAVPTARKRTTNAQTLRARALYNLGNTYWRMCQIKGDIPELLHKARDAYEKAIDVLPTHQSARVGIGLTYLRDKQPAEAVKWFNKALKYKPPTNELRIALSNQGAAYFTLKQYHNATESFRVMTRTFPDFTDGWLNLAQSLEMEKKPREALEALRKGQKSCAQPRRLDRAIKLLEKKLNR